MNELQEIRNPAALGAEIRALTQQFKYMTLVYGVEVGRRLTEAKEMLPHGEFGSWLRAETEFSAPTASRFMRLFNEYGGALGEGESNVSTLKKLSVSNALRLLALPEGEREEFAETHDVEHLSARELDRLMAERDEAVKRAEEAERQAGERLARLKVVESELDEAICTAANSLSEQEKRHAEELTGYEGKLAELRRENKELRERPVEVAVQIDEEAVKKAAEEAKAAADAEWSKKMAKAEKDAQKQVKELSGKAAEADKLREQLAEEEKRRNRVVAPYEDEIARLKKQLAMSGAELSAFKHYFTAWQQCFNQMAAALAAVPDELKANCLAGIRAAIEQQTGMLN